MFISEYTVNLKDLTTAIARASKEHAAPVSPDRAKDTADFVLSFFGYSTCIPDNLLSQKDRLVFNKVYDLGLITTDEEEEVRLYDGKRWRVHYWMLMAKRIRELAETAVQAKQVKLDQKNIYENPEVWEEVKSDRVNPVVGES